MVNKRVRNAVLGCNLKNDRMISVHFQGKPFNITVIQVYAPTCNAGSWTVLWRPTRPLELTPKKDVLFIIGDWNVKVGSQETLRVTGKFGLGVQNEAGQRLTEFCQKNALVTANTSSNNSRDEAIHGPHQRVNTEIRLIKLFVAKDGEALYHQQKKKKTRSWLWLRSWTPNCKFQT